MDLDRINELKKRDIAHSVITGIVIVFYVQRLTAKVQFDTDRYYFYEELHHKIESLPYSFVTVSHIK